MKKTDIAMIILIASFGVLVAYLVASSIPWLKPPEDGVKVRTIVRITPGIEEQPSKKIFNDQAINPTVPVVLE